MKKSSQFILAIIMMIAIALLGWNAYLHQKNLLLLLIFGLFLGYVLYRSGICFAAMYQNLFLFREFSMVRAIILMTMLSLLGIGLIQAYGYVTGGLVPGRLHSVGFHTAVGGFVFGIGMVVAGSCASGTLQRIGEGFLLFWLVLMGIVVGSTLGASHFTWWITKFYSHPPVFLPDVLGWKLSIIVSMGTLGILYILTWKIENKGTLIERCKKWLTKS